jgi:hypothetical protein
MNIVNLLVRGITGAMLAGATAVAFAGAISDVKVEPANAVVGAQVKVTVSGADEGNCGLRVEYGNGDADVTKMSAGKDNFPRSFTKTYNKAGTYTVIAKGGKEGSTFGCPGEVKTTVTIAEAPKPVAAASAGGGAKPAAGVAAAPAPVCPEAYNLDKKSVNKKTGAFACYATKGAKKPEKMIDCPDGTESYATAKSAGCRKVAAAKK